MAVGLHLWKHLWNMVDSSSRIEQMFSEQRVRKAGNGDQSSIAQAVCGVEWHVELPLLFGQN